MSIGQYSVLQLNVFLQGLLHVPVGLTVSGFFMITKESVITVSDTFVWVPASESCKKPTTCFLFFQQYLVVLALISDVWNPGGLCGDLCAVCSNRKWVCY